MAGGQYLCRVCGEPFDDKRRKDVHEKTHPDLQARLDARRQANLRVPKMRPAEPELPLPPAA
jgi:hypothetical protein